MIDHSPTFEEIEAEKAATRQLLTVKVRALVDAHLAMEAARDKWVAAVQGFEAAWDDEQPGGGSLLFSLPLASGGWLVSRVDGKLTVKRIDVLGD
jgi:hypothetical protein